MRKKIVTGTLIFCLGFMTALPVSQAFGLGDIL